MHIRNQLSEMRLESQSSQGSIQDTVHREAQGLNQTLSVMRRDQAGFESRLEMRLRQMTRAIAAPQFPVFAVEADVQDLVVMGNFDPEIMLAPPLRALRDFAGNSGPTSLACQLIVGEIETLLASTYGLCAGLAKSRADRVYDVSASTTQHAGSHDARIFSTQSHRCVKALEMENAQSVKNTGWTLVKVRNDAAKLVLGSTHRWTRHGTRQAIFLQCIPRTTSGQQGYGISFLFEVYQSLPGVDSILRNIRPYIVRPSEADIFTYAREGDIPAIDALFRNGKASVIDHDEEGFGLLVVS